jgi:3-hydroxyacyl-CoA dehydrogenase/enoyl-CoA hydratase/3-hydroxybutyryl-CoA epimerase
VPRRSRHGRRRARRGEGGFFGELDLAWLHEAARGPARNARRVRGARPRRSRSASTAAAKPFAAAITRPAHGAAFELALACQRRFVANDPACTVGFTDLRLGLPPLMGSGVRLASRLGAEPALKLLRDPTALTPTAAAKAGLVDVVLPGAAVLAEAARWVALAAAQRAQRPADAAIVAAAIAAPRTAIDAATEAFVDVARGPVAQDMVRTLGLSVARANRLAGRPSGHAVRAFSRVGVLGAGLMGSGIALVCARAGMQVTLLDTSIEAAERGLAALTKQEASGVAAGRLDAAESKATLARIAPSARYDDLAGVDIVVEAVFEDREVKAKATRLAEAAAGLGALFATNTSTLPITGLAEASARPERFIGLHFFSPVPRMPLLEIIRGRQTSDETLAHAMDFARAIGKTPIVVSDARGFYTTRVVMAYQAEAFDMLAQGIDPALVEAGGTASGMPVPPLALSDAVALDLIHQINLQAARDLGDAYAFTSGYRMVGRLVEEQGRKGKKTGQGFYDYGADGSRSLWPGLRAFAAEGRRVESTVADARDRLLAAQALETVRCLEEGVIVDPSQCDVGAILGWASRRGPAGRCRGSTAWASPLASRAARRWPRATARPGSSRRAPCASSRRAARASMRPPGRAEPALAPGAPSADSRSAHGAALAVAAMLLAIWGANFMHHQAGDGAVSPNAFLFARYIVTPLCAVLLLLALHGVRWPRLPRAEWIVLARLALLGHVLHVTLINWGIYLSSPFSTALIFSCGPLMTLTLLAVGGQERFGRAQLAGALIACAGILVFLADKLGLGWQAGLGDLVLLAATLLFSMHTVAARDIIVRRGPTLVMTYTTIMAFPVLMLITGPAGLGTDWTALPPLAWLGLAWALVVSSFAGWILWAG